MLENQKSYEKGLEDLELTCDAYIEEIRRKNKCVEIGRFIQRYDEKNKDNKITYDIKYYYYIVGLVEEISRKLNIKVNSGIWWSFEDGGHVELI